MSLFANKNVNSLHPCLILSQSLRSSILPSSLEGRRDGLLPYRSTAKFPVEVFFMLVPRYPLFTLFRNWRKTLVIKCCKIFSFGSLRSDFCLLKDLSWTFLSFKTWYLRFRWFVRALYLFPDICTICCHNQSWMHYQVPWQEVGSLHPFYLGLAALRSLIVTIVPVDRYPTLPYSPPLSQNDPPSAKSFFSLHRNFYYPSSH